MTCSSQTTFSCCLRLHVLFPSVASVRYRPNMQLSYTSISAVIQNLDFVKRKRLHSKCPSIRKCEERIGYSFGKILVMEDDKQVVLLFGPLVVTFRLRNGYTEVHYSDMRMQGQQEFREHTFTVKGVSVAEAARRWVEYYLNRPATRIDRLELRESPACIQNCKALQVETLLLWCQPNSSLATWFPSTIPPKTVRTEWQNMLQDTTVINARHFQWRGTRKLRIEQLMKLNCHLVEMFCHVDAEVVEGYCRAIVRQGRSSGYTLCFRDFEEDKLGKLVRKLEATERKVGERECFIVPMGPFLEIKMWKEANNSLTIRVDSKNWLANEG